MSYEYLAARYPLTFVMEPNRGSIVERVTGIAGAVTGTPTMLPGKGLGNLRSNTNYVAYGDNFNITDVTQPFTWVVVGTMPRTLTQTRLMAKHNAATGWALLIQVAGGVAYIAPYLRNAGTLETRYAWTRPDLLSVIAITYDGGLVAAGVATYLNAVPLAQVVTSNTLANASLANAEVMSFGPRVTAAAPPVGVQFAAFINQALTPAQVADLYQHLVQTLPAKRKPTKCFSLPYPGRTPPQYAAESIVTDVVLNLKQGRLEDRANPGNPYNIQTAYPRPDNVWGQFGIGLRVIPGSAATSNFIIRTTNNSQAFQTPNYTLESVFQQLGSPTSGGGGIHSSGSSGNGRVEQLAGGGGYSMLSVDAGSVVRTSSIAWVTGTGRTQHVAVQRVLSGADLRHRFYVNGVVAGDTVFAGAGLIAAVPNVARIGQRPGGSSCYNGTLYMLRHHNRELSAAEIRDSYLKNFARLPLLDARLNKDGSVPVSASPIIGAQQSVPGTPYTTGEAGNWRVVEAASTGVVLGKRTISYATSGDVLYAPDTSAYGSWYYEVRPTSLATSHVVHFVALGKVAASFGYSLYITTTGSVQLHRTTGATLFSTAAGYCVANTLYSFWITRKYSGSMTVWIRGGVYTNWTLVSVAGGSGTNPVTDTNYTVNKYVVLNRNGGTGEYGDLIHYQGDMTPLEASALGLLDTPATPYTQFAEFTSTDTTQNHTVRMTPGTMLYVDWGDGDQTWVAGTGVDTAITKTYLAAGTYTQKWWISNPAGLQRWYIHSNILSGSVPALSSAFSSLIELQLHNNNLSGVFPSYSYLPALLSLRCYVNTFTGPPPALPSSMTSFLGEQATFSGTVPSLSHLAALVTYRAHTNSLTGYTPSTLATTITTFNLNTNNLTQASVDQVLADFLTNAAARPAAGTIDLAGVGNAAPSAAGLASRNAFLALKPGWTVLVNP